MMSKVSKFEWLDCIYKLNNIADIFYSIIYVIKHFPYLFAGKNCVHIAVENNNIEILKYLFYAGADINARVSLLLIWYFAKVTENEEKERDKKR